jgi:hypothetical protein
MTNVIKIHEVEEVLKRIEGLEEDANKQSINAIPPDYTLGDD